MPGFVDGGGMYWVCNSVHQRIFRLISVSNLKFMYTLKLSVEKCKLLLFWILWGFPHLLASGDPFSMTCIYNFFLKLHPKKVIVLWLTFLLPTNEISDQANLRCQFKLKISVKSMLKVRPNSIDQSSLGLWKIIIWFLDCAA